MADPVTPTLSAGKLLLALRPGYAVRRNNRAVEREYENLVRWARDESLRERSQLVQLAHEMNASNLFRSSTHENGEQAIHGTFAQRWRDRSSESARLIEDTRDAEHPLYHLWRVAARRCWPVNPYSDEIAQISADWEDFTPEPPQEPEPRRIPEASWGVVEGGLRSDMHF